MRVEAFREVRHRRPLLVILDTLFQGKDLVCLELLDGLRRETPYLPVVMISGHGNIETAVTAIKRGAYDYIEKPFKSDRLLLIVERAIEAARLRRENAELRLKAGAEAELVGQSQASDPVRAALGRVPPTRTYNQFPARPPRPIAASRPGPARRPSPPSTRRC